MIVAIISSSSISTDESAINTSIDCSLDKSSYVTIQGEITGKIFNIHA